MTLDILLPSILFSIAVAIIFLYAKFEKKVGSILGGTELRIQHVVLLVAAIGMMVTILLFVPEIAVRIFFLFAYSTILFLFAYLLTTKWYLAIPIPVLFITLHLSPYWNIYSFNFFAIIFAICISVYVGSLFTWKTTAAFVALLTIIDIIQVLITGHMIAYGQKAITLGLPVAIIIPTFPSVSWTILGLGDIFLFGLLSIQTTRKYGTKFGLASIVSTTAVFFIFQTILLNTGIESFPATVMVISGWLTALGARYLYKSRIAREIEKNYIGMGEPSY